ncbi:hypothetical protein K438DRAFT_1788942 [Mycena galopus ATCC 62051]|nr:hypothetical protein K438DRAFT_1788942 [Mycena galopus ATCC 62051]
MNRELDGRRSTETAENDVKLSGEIRLSPMTGSKFNGGSHLRSGTGRKGGEDVPCCQSCRSGSSEAIAWRAAKILRFSSWYPQGTNISSEKEKPERVVAGENRNNTREPFSSSGKDGERGTKCLLNAIPRLQMRYKKDKRPWDLEAPPGPYGIQLEWDFFSSVGFLRIACGEIGSGLGDAGVAREVAVIKMRQSRSLRGWGDEGWMDEKDDATLAPARILIGCRSPRSTEDLL